MVMDTFLTQEVIAAVTIYQIFIILHLFGLALGAGAAFFSDFLFTHIMKERRITDEQFAILQINSRVIWLGLSILIVTGLCIFLGNTERLLDSSKFLAKMSIVSILTLNGILFHFKHIPMLKRYIGKKLNQSMSFYKESTSLFMSGALSGVSWAAALVLGALSFVDLSYPVIMLIYAVVVVLAVISSIGLQKFYLKSN